MSQKQFHVISTGISLITNAQRKGIFQDIKVLEEQAWQEILDNPSEIEKLYNFLKENPCQNSAEINTLYNFIGDYNHELIEVYLFGTNTSVNELNRIVLKKFLATEGFILYEEPVFEAFMISNDEERFIKDIHALVSHLINIAKKKIDAGYQVYFNPTGGLKAHVIATSVVAFILNCPTYYMNEEFRKVVLLPNLIYLPNEKEIDLLTKLSDKKPIRGKLYETLKKDYCDEINNLINCGLLLDEKDENGISFGLQITESGIFILSQIKLKYNL
ncbi:MAG: putative CRISPR-associated protein [Bacteroidales bacterium]|nr:putative CRISPR-associated protein [Bacteroidales bacterium]